MSTIVELQQRAAALKAKYQKESISPEEVGQLHEDTLAYIADLERYVDNLGVRKTYSGKTEMDADVTPVGTNGKAMRYGQLAVIRSSDNENGNIYAYQKPGWLLVGNLNEGKVVNDLVTGGSNVPLSAEQGKVLDEKIRENAAAIPAIADNLVTDDPTKTLSAKQGKKLYEMSTEYDVSAHNGGKAYTLTGTAQVVRLTITGAPTADGTITITLGGTSTTITITAATQNTAELIAAQVATGTFSGYTVSYTSGNSYVDFNASAIGEKAALAVEFGATGVTGSISATTAGADSAIAAVPTEFQKGGLTIAFVDVTRGVYVRHSLCSTSWPGNPKQWLQIANMTDISNEMDNHESDCDEWAVLDKSYKRVFCVDKNGAKARKYSITDADGNVTGVFDGDVLDEVGKIDGIVKALDRRGDTCRLQKQKGRYYSIKSYSTTGNVTAKMQDNVSRWGDKALKIEVSGIDAVADATTSSSRGTVTMMTDDIPVDSSLSLWMMIPSYFVVAKESGVSLVYTFYNGDTKIASTTHAPCLYDYWLCGWWLNKMGTGQYNDIAETLKGTTINKVVISITTKDSNPSFGMYVDSLVADQMLIPSFNYNLDYGFEDDYSLEVILYLYKNYIPVDCRIDFTQDVSSIIHTDIRSMTANECRSAGITGKMIVLKGYYEGLFDYAVYSNAAIKKKYTAAVDWLTSDMTNPYSISSILASGDDAGNSPVRELIFAANWQHRLDDTLLLAERKAGFKIVRQYGHLTHYIDDESCVMSTLIIGAFSSTSVLSDDWVEAQFASVKTYIDRAISQGALFSLMSHGVAPVSYIKANSLTTLLPLELLAKVIDYVVVLRDSGNIRLTNMTNFFKHTK